MANNDPLSEVISVGYSKCVQALRVQRDVDRINQGRVSAEQFNEIRAKYPSIHITNFHMDLEAHAFKLRTEALEAVEGKAE